MHSKCNSLYVFEGTEPWQKNVSLCIMLWKTSFWEKQKGDLTPINPCGDCVVKRFFETFPFKFANKSQKPEYVSQLLPYIVSLCVEPFFKRFTGHWIRIHSNSLCANAFNFGKGFVPFGCQSRNCIFPAPALRKTRSHRELLIVGYRYTLPCFFRGVFGGLEGFPFDVFWGLGVADFLQRSLPVLFVPFFIFVVAFFFIILFLFLWFWFRVWLRNPLFFVRYMVSPRLLVLFFFRFQGEVFSHALF